MQLTSAGPPDDAAPTVFDEKQKSCQDMACHEAVDSICPHNVAFNISAEQLQSAAHNRLARTRDKRDRNGESVELPQLRAREVQAAGTLLTAVQFVTAIDVLRLERMYGAGRLVTIPSRCHAVAGSAYVAPRAVAEEVSS